MCTAFVLAVLIAACGGSTDDDGSGSGGTSGSSGSGGSAGSGGSSGSGGAGGSGGSECRAIAPCCDSQGNAVDPVCPGGGPPQCPPGTTVPPTGICEANTGCSPSVPCAADEFCDYPDDACGAGAAGTCKPRPRGCDLLYAPVCGCDGAMHGNECAAHSAGVDPSATGGCTPPAGLFACGPHFCETATQYCRRDVSDVGGLPDVYACQALPASCGSAPSCACLAGEMCGDWCAAGASGELTLTCPGG